MGQILSILFYTIVLVLAAMFLYLWPILAYFVCTTKQVVKNALYMCLGHLPWTALLLLYFGLVWFIMTRSILTLGIVVGSQHGRRLFPDRLDHGKDLPQDLCQVSAGNLTD